MTRAEVVAELRAAIKRRQEAIEEGPDKTRVYAMSEATFNAIHAGAIAGMSYAITLLTE